jgi:hypothetical protein
MCGSNESVDREIKCVSLGDDDHDDHDDADNALMTMT